MHAKVRSYQSTQADSYPSPSHTRVVGSCTGLLTAAAVGSCVSLVDLLDIAVEIVIIAFRIGALVASTGTDIERSLTKSPSWSAAVSGLTAERAKEILDAFHESEVRCTCLSLESDF